MQNIEKQIQNWFLTKKMFTWTYSIILILTGLFYIFFEFSETNEIKDPFFIGLLYGGSFILLLGIKWIQIYFIRNVSNFHQNLDDRLDFTYHNFEEYTKKIFKNPLAIKIGVLYGILVGSVPFLFNLWPEHSVLNVLLSFFLFTVNFLTGTALFCLLMLFIFLYKTSIYIVIGLYDRYNSSSIFITDLSKRASLIASFYVAFSLSSIYFSELPMNTLTIGYSIFAGLVIIMAYIIPMIPIRNKVQALKKEAVIELSGHIQHELDSLLDNARTNKNINTEKYNSLIELRAKLLGLQSLPIGLKVIWNSISILVITLLPVIIQVLLEKMV